MMKNIKRQQVTKKNLIILDKIFPLVRLIAIIIVS
jgi:hypothetical protein